MERWKTLAAEGTAVSLPPTNKQTQVRTFTLHAVRNLAGPALSLARVKTAADRGDQRHNEDRDAQAPLTPPRAPFIVHDGTLNKIELPTRQGRILPYICICVLPHTSCRRYSKQIENDWIVILFQDVYMKCVSGICSGNASLRLAGQLWRSYKSVESSIYSRLRARRHPPRFIRLEKQLKTRRKLHN